MIVNSTIIDKIYWIIIHDTTHTRPRLNIYIIVLFYFSFYIALATSTEVNITTPPESKSACYGTVVHFNCHLSGTNVFPNWRINGKEYSPSTLPPNYYPRPDGLTVHIVHSHSETFQCVFHYIPKSGLPVLVSSDIANLSIFSGKVV